MSRRRAGGWQALPPGRFTGLDWSDPQAYATSDPYLAWAETSGFAGFRSPLGADADPLWLPLLIELAPDTGVADLVAHSDPAWLQVPRIYLSWASLRFCTARAQRGFFEALAPGGALCGKVLRYELGLPVGHHARGLAPQAVARAGDTPPRLRQRVAGPVVVIIDNGIALGHANFLDAQGQPRVAAFWRQDATEGPHGRAAATRHPVPLDPRRAGPTPPDIGYGHELKRTRIEAAITRCTQQDRLDEDALYRHLQLWELQHAGQHGTHVASLAAGPRMPVRTIGHEDSPPDWRPADDVGSRASLVVAQLDWASAADSSGGALNVSVLDALAWALTRCVGGAPAAINLSWGALAGAHNGSSLIESAMAQLIAASGLNAQLVVPAGNAYQAQTHANARLAPGESVTLHWRVQPDDHSQSFLECWLQDVEQAQHTVAGVQMALTPPGQQQPLPSLAVGETGVWPSTAAPQCALLFPPSSALGAPGACALLAVAPTARWFPGTVCSPPGVWRLTITNRGPHAVVLDACIERDDEIVGTQTGARQSYLQDRRYDTSGGLGSFIDHPDNPTPVRRSGSFNDLATGTSTLSVGGIRYFGSCMDPMARYSPRSPDPDASRPERTGVQKVPDRFAVSDEHATLWGVRAAGTRSASAVRMVGTSMAAPQVARLWLDGAALPARR